MDEHRHDRIDWRRTIKFTLWLCSPVIAVGLYLVVVEILFLLWDYGK